MMSKKKRDNFFNLTVQVEDLEHIEFKIDYRFDGIQMSTGEKVTQGYYAKMQPVELTEISRSFVAFTGVNVLVKPTGPYRSVPLYQEAMEVTKEHLMKYLKIVWEKKKYSMKHIERVHDAIIVGLNDEIEYYTIKKRK